MIRVIPSATTEGIPVIRAIPSVMTEGILVIPFDTFMIKKKTKLITK